MERGEHEVPCLCRAESRLNGLGVAHLADENHVRVFPKRRAQRHEEARGVEAHLPLADCRQLVLVQNLYRVLDRDDMALTRPVDVVDHGGQRGGLATPGRSCHEDEAALFVGEAPDGLGQAQLAEGPGMRPDQPEDHPDRAALPVAVDPEAPEVRDGVREVGLVRLVEVLPGPRLHDFFGDLHHVFWPDDRHVSHACELAVDPHSRWRARLQVEIGTFGRR